jgi:hypothetical protein
MTNIHDFIFFSCALYFSVPANRASQSGGGKRGIASLCPQLKRITAK